MTGPPEPPISWSELAETLGEGRFHLVIAVDPITPELRSIIEYLNLHLSETVTIVAFELGRVLAGDVQVLVPKTYGAEVAERRDRVAGVRRRWTATDVEEAVAEIESVPVRLFVERLLKHASDRGAVVNGGTGPIPSAGYYYSLENKRRSIFSLYVGPDGPTLSLNLAAIARVSQVRAQLVLKELRRSAAFSERLPLNDEVAATKYPEVTAAALASKEEEAAAFWAAMHAAIDDAESGTDSSTLAAV